MGSVITRAKARAMVCRRLLQADRLATATMAWPMPKTAKIPMMPRVPFQVNSCAAEMTRIQTRATPPHSAPTSRPATAAAQGVAGRSGRVSVEAKALIRGTVGVLKGRMVERVAEPGQRGGGRSGGRPHLVFGWPGLVGRSGLVLAAGVRQRHPV